MPRPTKIISKEVLIVSLLGLVSIPTRFAYELLFTQKSGYELILYIFLLIITTWLFLSVTLANIRPRKEIYFPKKVKKSRKRTSQPSQKKTK